MSNPDLMSDDWKRGTELLEKEFQKWQQSIERGGGIAVDSFLASGWECELVGRLARERDEAQKESRFLLAELLPWRHFSMWFQKEIQLGDIGEVGMHVAEICEFWISNLPRDPE